VAARARSRYSCAVAGKRARVTPAANDGTSSNHGASSAGRSVVRAVGRPARAAASSSSHRDAKWSPGRRRSPRGKHSTTAPPEPVERRRRAAERVERRQAVEGGVNPFSRPPLVRRPAGAGVVVADVAVEQAPGPPHGRRPPGLAGAAVDLGPQPGDEGPKAV